MRSVRSSRSSPDFRTPAPVRRILHLAPLALGLALAPLCVTLGAQQPAEQQAGTGVVAGVVVAAANQRPLSDVQVAVAGTSRGVVTDAAGRFRLTGLAGDNVTLDVRRLGFAPVRVSARVGDANVTVQLRERVVELNQVVVTGTAGATTRRAIGNAVSTVHAADVVATQPVRNVQDLLTGRASGVSVVASSGQVGTGARIRVRGASSLSLGNDPLVFVDGIRTDNAQATGPSNQSFGSSSISRWNDFNPDDIESIEVIKGPAAATLYGTEASNGVVQIITKRGVAGRPVWNFTGRLGSTWLPGGNAGYFTNYGVVPRAGSATIRDTVALTMAQLNDSSNAHFGHDVWGTGAVREMHASVSGGADQLRYYVAAGHGENQGVERTNRLNATNARVNVTASPSRTVDVQASMGYVTERIYLPYESGGGGATWATFFSSPAFLYNGSSAGSPQLGFRSGPPDIYYQAYTIFQDAQRFTGSLQVTNRPLSWLDHRLILGIDRIDEDNQEQAPRNDPLGQTYAAFSDLAGGEGGYLAVGTRAANNITADYVANARYRILSSWQGVTSAGGQFYGRRTRLRGASGTGFPAAGILSLSAASVQSQDYDDVFDNNTLGGFVQQQLIWNDRLFLTGALRRDKNSAFGANFPAVTYPKAQVSYVISEEPALRIPSVFSTLRLRAAYGGSGLQPGAFDALRTYNASFGTLTPGNAGNLDLGPEKSYESEFGLDASVLDDRYGAEGTFFTGQTKDAILSRTAPPSGGFPGLQFFNAGRVDRRGFEWLLRAQPVRGERFTLDLGLSGSVTKYEIKSLGPGTNAVSLSSQIEHVVGYAPGAWWDRRVVSATYDPATKSVPRSSMMCDDGKGGTTPCYSGSTLVAPRVYLGNSVPTREGSFTAGITFLRNFRLNNFIDYRGGYSKLDGNRRVRCHLFSLCEENYYKDKFANDPVRLAADQGGSTFTYDLIQKADFVRWRELSLTYTLPGAYARALRASGASITVAGRNLNTSTKYGGLEPEASFNGGTRGGAFGQWEQNVLPQTRSFLTTVNLSF